ncbi:MAG: CDC48 family AAA ATPase [Candidatus Micrarchaeota archaeon]|nr:CDC48 family AAA ATPase [Candidatus Micrarchaeota archaeon]
MADEKNIILKVSESLRSDVGRSIARLDSKARKELSLSVGDFIRLAGKRQTIAIVWPAHPEDEGLDIIRIDGILRNNAGVGIGEKVKVFKTEIKEASRIILAPKEQIRYSPELEDYVHKRLINRPMIKGDMIPIGVFGTALPLSVVQTQPQGAIIVTEATQISIKSEPEKTDERIPTVTYEDIGGLGEPIQKIREMVEIPMRHPELFERLGIEPPKGVLLYGTPGTGKTLLAKAVANESDASFYYIGGPEIVSKYVGESEQKLRKIFEDAEKSAPSIIFIDEIDAIAPKREESQGEVERRMVSQLLTLMDGLKNRGQVVVIGATNRPETIDPALRRPGRFDREIEISVPDKAGRREILEIHMRNVPLDAMPPRPDLTAKLIISSIVDSYPEKKEMINDNKKDIEKLLNILCSREAIASVYSSMIMEETKEKAEINPDMLYSKLAAGSIVKYAVTKAMKKGNPEEKYSVDINKVIDTNIIIGDINQAIKRIKSNDAFEFPDMINNRQVMQEMGTMVSSLKSNEEFSSSLSKLISSALIDEMAQMTYGYTGADMSALVKESAIKALRRILPELNIENVDEQISEEMLEKINVTTEDFFSALNEIQPSALRELYIERPNVKWDDIGGLDGIKAELKEAVELPLKNPEIFEEIGIRALKGVLLFGVPGTGKTLLAKAVASESDANFVAINGPEVLSKWVGESEKAVREIFRKARLSSPCIIFIDEIDAIAPKRGSGDEGTKVTERMVNTLLTEMDGIRGLNSVFVIGATNRPDILDTALLRAGRFDKIIEIPLPDENSRRSILEIHTRRMALAKDINKEEIVKMTGGFSGADIENLVREAGMNAIRRLQSQKGKKERNVRMDDFMEAFKNIRPPMKFKEGSKKSKEEMYG